MDWQFWDDRSQQGWRLAKKREIEQAGCDPICIPSLHDRGRGCADHDHVPGGDRQSMCPWREHVIPMGSVHCEKCGASSHQILEQDA